MKERMTEKAEKEKTEKGKNKESKRKLTDLLVKAGSLWAAALAATPLFACGARLAPAHSPLRWMVLPYAALILSCAALAVPARKARPAAVCAVLCTAALSFFFMGGGLPGAVSALACAALCFICLSRRSSLPGQEWGYGFWITGLIIQLLLWSMFVYGNVFDHPDFPRAAAICGAGTCVFFLLFLFFMNRMTLIAASHADITARKVPSVIRFRNTAAVILLFALAVITGFSEKIGNAVSAAWNGILTAIGAVIRFIISLFSYTPVEGGPGGGDGGGEAFLPAAETAEPSLFAVILEKTFMGLSFLLAVFLFALALRVLWKALIRLAELIRFKLTGMLDRASEDYTDTVDDTRGGKQDEDARRRRFGARREPRPQTGTDLVRYLYRRFLKKHPERQGRTCREALKDSPERESFTRLYERARYGGQSIDMEESEALERKLKKKA